tara:strand:- start:757 stop:1125 length:369 start_codon:yes stop_codon:yes gene_type:complete
MKTFNIESHNSNKYHVFSLINKYATDIYGKSYSDFNFSPYRCELKAFGGSLSIEQFRQNSSKSLPWIFFPPVEHIEHLVDSNETFSVRSSHKESASKLQRSKPLKHSQNTLDSFMGLTRVDP